MIAWRRVGLVLFSVGWGANHFAALLPVYRQELALDPAAPALIFAMYALGLVPGLLFAGPLSDRRGRRPVVLAAAIGALLASSVLGVFGGSFHGLLLGRLLYGLAAGAVMSPGAVWTLDLSRDTPGGLGPRRATIALSAGFGLGPLITGALAEYAPWPTRLPFVAHVLVLALSIAIAWTAPDRSTRAAQGALLRFDLDRRAWWRFVREVALMAPFVFGFPTIAFAAIPAMLGGALGPASIGGVAALTLAMGVVAQPLTRRFSPLGGARLGLAAGAAGIGVGILAVATHTPLLVLLSAAVLGVGYGMCMTSGLRAVEQLAPPHARGALTGLYYVLTYVGFAAPYVLAIAVRSARPETALAVTAGLVVLAALSLPTTRSASTS